MHKTILPPINHENWDKITQYLRALPPEKFNIAFEVSEWDEEATEPCGSICCAMGWMPDLFPDVVQWTDKNKNFVKLGLTISYDELAEKLMGGLPACVWRVLLSADYTDTVEDAHILVVDGPDRLHVCVGQPDEESNGYTLVSDLIEKHDVLGLEEYPDVQADAEHLILAERLLSDEAEPIDVARMLESVQKKLIERAY